MKKKTGTTHVVVDGSNIATEGRSKPSLAQLNEAVLSYVAEHPATVITVVVDATFGHRIDRAERDEFDAAVANNELVAPPAGAVGRGDAFVLGIADKAGAVVLSNDSFQEFHGSYEWLFEPGRLVGGKPVPNVGWVFVERVPVRGPVSRKAVKASKSPAGKRASSETDTPARRRASAAASEPMPVPKTPPPGSARRGGSTSPVNDLLPFLEFAERHRVGTEMQATVDSYSSHGAYVTIGDVRGYVPLRSMGDPPPPSARALLSIGQTVTVRIAEFAASRRSIDCALVAVGEAPPAGPAAARQSAPKAAPAMTAAPANKAAKKAAAKKAPAKMTAARKTAAPEKAAAKKAAAKKVPARKTAAPEKAAAKKAAVKKAPARKTAAPEKAAAKKAAAKKAPAKKTAAPRAVPANNAAPVKQVPDGRSRRAGARRGR